MACSPQDVSPVLEFEKEEDTILAVTEKFPIEITIEDSGSLEGLGEQLAEIYNLRRQIVEPVFGDIRENKGVTSFITRSLKTVKTEFNLICTANNIRRIHKKGDECNKGNFMTIFYME
jgi:hypothetical protein